MSERKSVLACVLNELDEGFRRLSELWQDEDVVRPVLAECQNIIIALLRVVRGAKLNSTEEAEALEKLRRIANPYVTWSAAYVHMVHTINDLEKRLTKGGRKDG